LLFYDVFETNVRVTLDHTEGGNAGSYGNAGKWVFVAKSTFITGANAKVIIKVSRYSHSLFCFDMYKIYINIYMNIDMNI
jgi:hypothetical protein